MPLCQITLKVESQVKDNAIKKQSKKHQHTNNTKAPKPTKNKKNPNKNAQTIPPKTSKPNQNHPDKIPL